MERIDLHTLSTKRLSVLLWLALLASAFTPCSSQPQVRTSSSGLLIAGASPVEGLIEQAKAQLSQQRYDQAIPILQKAALVDPRSMEAHFYLGSAFYHLKDMEKAIAEYQAVLSLQPDAAEAMFNLGSCYEHSRRFDDAVSWYEKYLTARPHAADAPDVRRSIGEIRKIVEIHSLFNESRSLLEQKRPLDARFLLEKAAALQPESPEIHYNLGMAYHDTGNLPKAIEEFQRALQLKPDMTDAVLNIGSSYQALGQKSEAVGWFQTYLKANPQTQDYKAISDLINSLQNESSKQTADDPHAADFFASVTKAGSVRRWPREKLPIKVYIDLGTGVAGMRDSFPRILAESFDAWMKAAQGAIAYQIVPRKDLADLVCDWTSNPGDVTGKGTESEQGVAHIYGKDFGRGVVEISRATIRVLTIDREKGGEQPVTADVMKKTCLHEVGHALGLMGHSPNAHDVMFFSESPTVWPVLSKRDKATLLRLYESYPSTFGPTPLALPSP